MPSSNSDTTTITTREALIKGFLERSGFSAAERHKLPGDASFRRYERLIHNGKSYMLMDAPPPKENVRSFMNVDRYLIKQQMSAPVILADDPENGFLLLEDLGVDSYSLVLKADINKEESLYLHAMEALIHVQNAPLPSDIPDYTREKLLQETLLLTEWYMPLIGRSAAAIQKSEATYKSIMEKLIATIPPSPRVVVLRDYHADNLMWLPDRETYKRAGLLDFQDAVIGHPAYDVVSLLEDARRDVRKETVIACLDYYLAKQKAYDKTSFMMTYALLGAQRNCKIIGIFSRLAKRDGKKHYLDMIPRVWNHLTHDVAHPALKELKEWLDSEFPSELRKQKPELV